MKAESIMYVLDRLGGDGAYKRSGDHLMASCVHARWGHGYKGQDGDKKLGIMVQQGTAPLNCFYPGCIPDGQKTLLGLVQLVGGKRVAAGEMTAEQVSSLKAFVLMAEEDDDVPADTSWGQQRPKEAIPKAIIEALTGTSAYWLSRGISVDTATTWGLGEDAFRAHIPFRDRAGNLVAVQGRILPGVKKDAYDWDHKGHDEKFRSFPVGFERSELLVGEHLITKPVDFLVVVESPADAVFLTDCLAKAEPMVRNNILPAGGNSSWAVVATMGGEIAARQAQKMVELVDIDGELVLGFDQDHAGQLATRKTIGADKAFPGHGLYRRLTNITVCDWKGKDPSDTDGGKLPLDVVRESTLKALAQREHWLTRRMKASLK